jgi:hypothetical protein
LELPPILALALLEAENVRKEAGSLPVCMLDRRDGRFRPPTSNNDAEAEVAGEGDGDGEDHAVSCGSSVTSRSDWLLPRPLPAIRNRESLK